MSIRVDEREIFKNRVREYWQHILSGKIDKVYLYEIPEYREKVSIFEYVQRFKLVRYLEANVLDVEINGDEGKSTIEITYTYMLKIVSRERLKNLEKEVWKKQDNQWYHIPEGFEMAKK